MLTSKSFTKITSLDSEDNSKRSMEFLNKDKFNSFQLFELNKGIKKNLNVDLYKNPLFFWDQMRLIRKGLELNLDASLLANPNLNVDQMKQILLGLAAKIDVTLYNKVEFSARKMEQIRIGLQNRVDMSICANPNLSKYHLEAIRVCLENNIDVSKYLNPSLSLSSQQCDTIINSAKIGVDESRNIGGLKEVIEGTRLKELKKELESRKELYSWSQFIGLKNDLNYGHDISKYWDPNLKHWQADEIREGLENSIDMIPYVLLNFNRDQLLQIRLGLVDGIDASRFARKDLSSNKMYPIRYSLTQCKKLGIPSKETYDEDQIKQISLGIDHKIDVSILLDHNNSFIMEQLRLGLEQKLNLIDYLYGDLTAGQIEQIRLGLISKVDVTLYYDDNNTPKQMKKFRLQLEKERNS